MAQNTIQIKDSHGAVKAVVGVNRGAKGKFSLGGEDYITLPFNVVMPIAFAVGDYCDLTEFYDEADGMGNQFAKRYEIVELPSPTYDTSTGSYHYDLRLDAFYYAWKHKILKFIPESGAQETSWNLTAALGVHLNVVKKNLKELGYLYNGEEYDWSIENLPKADTAKLLSYNSTNIIDALNMLAQEWECEWWVTDKTIHFGRLEFGDEITLELGKEVSNMTRSESNGVFATRLYVFGAARNIPPNYRPVDSDVTVNGVVQKRLMLPEGTPYIDAYRYDIDGNKVWIGEAGYDTATEMSKEEAIEAVIATDDIYPRTKSTVTAVGSYTDTQKNEDGTENTETFYYVTTDGFQFDESYILAGSKLEIKFVSGKLNGMTFGCTFRKAGTTLDGKTLVSDVFEIVASEDYGRKLPAEPLIPRAKSDDYDGDQFVILGWDSTKMGDTGLVEDAQNELYNYGVEYIKRTMIDDSTYTSTLMSHWVYEKRIERTYNAGQKVRLINPSFFDGVRHSRIIGYELNLDIPYDAPQYTIGESVEYSRITDIESKVDEITYGGVQYQGGGGSSVYLIKNNDSTAPSEHNAYSASRADLSFLRKDIDDESEHGLTLRYLHVKGEQSNDSLGTDLSEDDTDLVEDVDSNSVSPALTEQMSGGGTSPSVDIDPSNIKWGDLQNVDSSVDNMARGYYMVQMNRGGKVTLVPTKTIVEEILPSKLKEVETTMSWYETNEHDPNTYYKIINADNELVFWYRGDQLLAKKGTSQEAASQGFPYTFPIIFS